MAELVKFKQVRNGHRMHTKKLMDKCDTDIKQLQDLKILLASLEKKQETLEKIDADILNELTEEGDIENEIEESSIYTDRIIEAKTKIQLAIEHFNRKSMEAKFDGVHPSVDTKPVVVTKSETQIKLPKITLKAYDGSLLKWSNFWGQFDAAVNKNNDLTEIQKFTYLQSFLSGEAERAISGLTLIKENYRNAVDVLTERFGNKQARISAHMKELRVLSTVVDINDVIALRKMYDTLDLNISNLKELDVDVSTYGSLLIAIIFDCIPEELRIKISLRFGSQDWTLDETMNVFKTELEARERSMAISGNKQSNYESNNCYSTQSLHLNTVRESTRDRKVNHSASSSFNNKNKSSNFNNKNKSSNFNNTNKIKVVCCVFCKEKHLSSRCRNVTDINIRYNIVRRENRCFVCLKQSHLSKDCHLNYSCLKCNMRHNIALCQQQYERQSGINNKLNSGAGGRETLSNVAHIEKLDEQQQTNESTITSSVEAGSTTNILVGSTSKVCHHDEIILQCALAEVCDIKEKRSCTTSVLFDGGSQRTYLTDALRNRLGLQSIRKESLILKRFASSEGLLRCLDVVQVCLKGKGGVGVYMEALCVPHICSPVKVPALSYMKNNYEYLRGIELASPPDANNNVDMLVGLDYYFSIVSGKTLRGPPGTPVAIESLLGWMICGRSNVPSTSEVVVTQMMLAEEVDDEIVEELDLKEELKRFWEVENIAGDINDIIHTKFNENIFYNGSRYVASLPFKSSVDFVPDNFQISCKRLLGLLTKLKKNPELNKEYRRIIDTYERDGIVEKVYDSGVPGKVHYLPHRPVVRNDRDTTKVRIVFDGSAKEKGGKSINDLLYAGPCLLPNIYDILLRFCFGKIAIIADIRQAFLNIELCDDHKDYVRFLFTDTEDDSKVQIYRFNRVCFGITSSPFLLNATIQYHMNRLKDEEPELSLKILRDIYVDDVTSNVNTVEEGVRFCDFARLSMAAAGFELQKWYSNSRELRQLMNSIEDDIERKKVLGVIWNKNDEFVFDFRQLVEKALKLPLTKRNLLRIGATFYDPIGLISPVVLIAKIYFQKVCLDGVNWDDVLYDDLAKGWNQYLKQLAEVECITVPRYLFTDTNDAIISNITLHGFCDSSKQAYCAAIYVQTKSSDGIISRLLTSKTKVAPIKKLSIPRLELLSCLLLAELMSSVCKVLQDIVIIDKKLFWSDSEVALSWIKAEGKEWKPWVKNRVFKIRQMSDVDDWFYVSTDLNPSDIGTRESSVVKFSKNNLWWYGPLFLREETKKGEVKNAEKDDLQDVNAALVLTSVPEDVLNEVDSSVVLLVNSDADEKFGIGDIINFERYSNFMKLLRVVVYVKRFINNCLKGKKKEIGEIVVEETEEALKLCIEWEQRSIVADKRFSNLRKQLSLFFDADGILRLQGRLENAHLKFDAKHPVLLNRHSYFTKLVILNAHLNVKHMRLKATLNEVRSRYWISRGKQTVKLVIKDCYHCKFVNAKTIVGPPPPDLPQYRVCFEFAFTNVGIDYAGPLYVKEIYGVDFKMHKAYILLFTCAATRGVHLELCPDMSASCLIRCLKRFISRRGKFNMAISDNFSSFVSAELKRFLLIEQIKWSHILPKSPWWGAFYERLIRIIKEALKKVVGKAKLTYEEMETVLGEIEMVINSRPLTYLYEEAEEALTPSHLVIGRRLLSNSMKGDNNNNNNTVEHSSDLLNNRYKYLQNVIEHYWKRFCKEYLFELHEHHLYVNSKGNYDEFCKLLLGDVVLIKDDSMKRNCWKKGRVEKMIYGNDNLIRGALLKVCHGDKVSYLERPLQRIIPLEVQRERTNNDVNVSDANDEVGSNSTVQGDILGDTEVDALRDADKTGNVNNSSQLHATDHSNDSVNNYKKRLRSYQRSQAK